MSASMHPVQSFVSFDFFGYICISETLLEKLFEVVFKNAGGANKRLLKCGYHTHTHTRGTGIQHTHHRRSIRSNVIKFRNDKKLLFFYEFKKST